ncbi:MAG: hypothetical protein DRR19_31745 [Candidatus Parabeggiatoa sp. nov. 1]|nr:MAG: hypothetical protein DRR19_31745 [Gammaproteobacteria bacterium]
MLLSTVISINKNGNTIWATFEKTCPNLPKEPFGAQKLTSQARKLEEGKTEQAKAKFAQARELDANVVFWESLDNNY